MKKFKYVLLILLLLYGFISCNTTEPLPNNSSAKLTLEDVSCTEAWLSLTTTDLQLPTTVDLIQNENIRKTINLATADTILYIDSLLPNQTYKFKISDIQSNEITATTLDTTSNNFTWQTYTFGGGAGSCALYDVAIINENDIWAVGEIYLLDSTGVSDPNAYNAVHWDGNEWNLKRIRTSACGGVDYPPIQAIFAFSSNDILFAHIDGSISHFDGTDFTNDCSLIILYNGSATKIWGVSRNDYYVVSVNGFIAHYHNGQWSRIESGTDANINDVWGVINPENNQTLIYCAVSNVFELSDQKILTIKDNHVDSLYWNTGRRVSSVWTDNPLYVYTSGGGVFNNKSGKWTEEISVPLYYTNMIRGTGLNDIFVVGDFGLLAHHNGVRWHVYSDFLNLPGASLYSISVSKNTVTAVGLAGNKALIVMGKRK